MGTPSEDFLKAQGVQVMPPSFKFVRSDLNLEIDKVRPEPGDILLVRPKRSGDMFSTEFANWLSTTLAGVLPPGVKAMIVSSDALKIERLSPHHLAGESFKNGWYAAFDALEKTAGADTDDEQNTIHIELP
jgi:hypothetical protein